MFDNLSDKLQDVFKKISGQARLTEANIADAMREIRLALLDADVNLAIVKEFIAQVREDCLGTEVLRSVSPGQQVIKIVNDRLVELMGESNVPLDLQSKLSVIMMVGLHGSGKTTSAAKLAFNLKKERRSVLLVAGDIYRPAAIDQLEFLGKEIDVPVFVDRHATDVAVLARQAIEHAKLEKIETVIIDTAGRLQIDDMMVRELIQINQTSRANEILLVADAALGQEAVSVAEHFHKALGITGLILTKLDGDARGGAALSIRKVTGCPIKFVGVGEKISDLEIFYPDRMASRILGMGDVVSLVEKAAEDIDEKEARRLEERLRKNKFDFSDFRDQLRQMAKLGGTEGILKMLPGGKQLAKTAGDIDPKQLIHMEAIIDSMTPAERAKPDLISMPRRRRISTGCGRPIEAVSSLIKQFKMMQKMMRKGGLLKRLMGGGSIAGMENGGFPDSGGYIEVDHKAIARRRKAEKKKKKQKQKQRRKKR